jgi:hypothetical protein
MEQSEAAFLMAIEKANVCQLHLLECFARRDYMKCVLEPNTASTPGVATDDLDAGAVESLRRCIDGLHSAMGEMVGEQSEYEALLGLGPV